MKKYQDQGSSPLTRGAPGLSPFALYGFRLIPAHAGSTDYLTVDEVAHMAHPRSRGEHRTRRERASRAPGSSPLTRGARCSPGGGLGRFRLIPAHAGSTLSISALGKDARAHPRSRGEHSITSGLVVPPFGSSPLTRGARPSLRKHGVTPRLIPAHAGSTTNLRTVRRESEAHPRSRGEHTYRIRREEIHEGSSPLTRGARF